MAKPEEEDPLLLPNSYNVKELVNTRKRQKEKNCPTDESPPKKKLSQTLDTADINLTKSVSLTQPELVQLSDDEDNISSASPMDISKEDVVVIELSDDNEEDSGAFLMEKSASKILHSSSRKRKFLLKAVIANSSKNVAPTNWNAYSCKKWTPEMINFYNQDDANVDFEDILQSMSSDNQFWRVVKEDRFGPSICQYCKTILCILIFISNTSYLICIKNIM